MSNSNIHYASSFLNVETLQTRHHDSLDFYEVSVGSVTAMLKKIAADANKTLTDTQIVHLINTNLWETTHTGITTQNSDSLDFHTVSIWGIRNIIEDTKQQP